MKIKSSLTILCKKFGLEHQLPKSTSIPKKKRKCIQKKLKYVNLFSHGIKLIVTSDHDHHHHWSPWCCFFCCFLAANFIYNLFMSDGCGRLCSLREIPFPTTQKRRILRRKQFKFFKNFNYLTPTPSQNKCFFNNKLCSVWISSTSLTHSPLVSSSSSSLVTSDHHPHQISFGVGLLLLSNFISSDSTNWDWWWRVRKDFQNRTQKTTKDARLGFRV